MLRRQDKRLYAYGIIVNRILHHDRLTARPARMPRKQGNLPFKVRRGELSVHPSN